MIDPKGNIVNKKGTLIWQKSNLNSEGEPPKIFQQTLFDIDRIKGNVNMDSQGNPVILKGPYGYKDRDGNSVNAKGYLVDTKGNIID